MFLAERVRAHAEEAPGRIAVAAGPRQMSYGELWQQALSFSAELGRNGFSPGDRVAVALGNCPEAVVAWYGTWLAGGVIVPLNAQARPHELAPWLRNCAPAVIIHEASGEHFENLPGMEPSRILQIAVGPKAAPRRARSWDAVLAVPPAPGNYARVPVDYGAPAMILYTSGTTGRPKGVTLSHRNLSSNAASIIQYLDLGASDSAVTVLPFYYSYGCSVLNTHLAVGARVVIGPSMAFPHAVLDTIVRERATGFPGVPSTFALLLSRVDLNKYDLGSLRYLTQAGGPMSVAHIQRLREAIPNARLFVMYGQTEATARLTWLPPEMLARKIGSVGVAIPGVEIEVRPEGHEAGGTGAVGEVWARGENVMLGYWRDEEMTSTVVRDGWLKTGDMGRTDSDGFLFLEGRRTDMIKVGAHRIYPRDVEEVIAEMPDIQEVAVVGVEDELLGEVIKAVAVPSAPGAVNAMAVQAHCRARLAPYKVPKWVEFVQKLPRTDSGKVRRHELKALGVSGCRRD